MDTLFFLSQNRNTQEHNKEKNTKPHRHSTPVHCWWGREFEKTPPEAPFDKNPPTSLNPPPGKAS